MGQHGAEDAVPAVFAKAEKVLAACSGVRTRIPARAVNVVPFSSEKGRCNFVNVNWASLMSDLFPPIL